MRWLVTALPALACLGMMLAMCIPMMRSRDKGHSDGASSSEMAELREEIARLKAERALDEERETADG